MNPVTQSRAPFAPTWSGDAICIFAVVASRRLSGPDESLSTHIIFTYALHSDRMPALDSRVNQVGDIERKTETVNLRLSPRMKELLRMAADQEHRTLSNMVEALVLDYCENKGLAVAQGETAASRTRKRSGTATRR